MATLTVRDLPDEDRDALRVRAAEHGRSMEAEVRALIHDALHAPAKASAEARVKRVQDRIRAANGGVMPTGVVDQFIAERRSAAARGE